MNKKILIVMILAILCICVAPGNTAHAATYIITSGNAGSPIDLSFLLPGDILQIDTTQPVELTGSAADIEIICSTDSQITLIDVTIHSSGCPIEFTGGVNVLTLSGDNELYAGASESAVFVYDRAQLSVYGPGTLYAQGAAGDANSDTIGGAGIGGYGSLIGINIYGGDITAIGGYKCPGIGIYSGATGYIYINNATVNATGGQYGAGIGSGYNTNIGNIEIMGASHVTATGNYGGAGIGGGYAGSGGIINIYDGTITAQGGTDPTVLAGIGGAGIGGGVGTIIGSAYSGGNYTSITLSGGTIHATGGTRASGIGGGYHTTSSNILPVGTITLGADAITAVGDNHAEAIGGGYGGNPAPIVITSGTISPVDALETRCVVYDIDSYDHSTPITISTTDALHLYQTTSSTPKYGVTLSYSTGFADLTIEGLNISNAHLPNACSLAFTAVGNTLHVVGQNTLLSGANEPGIKVEGGASGDLIISGSSTSQLNVAGGINAAGIGSGGDGITPRQTGIIVINSGNIDAVGGENAAGIGGGCYATSGLVSIEGDANIRASGGLYAAGIGTGLEGALLQVKVAGTSIVDAKGGEYGAGIGSGMLGYVPLIGIYASSNVTAGSLGYGAGIGGGYGSNSGDITIGNTPTVNATGGAAGAGIGGGFIYFDSYGVKYGGDCETVTIYGNPQITANGGYAAAGIGGALGGDGGEVTVNGGRVEATGGDEGAGIGGGAKSYNAPNYYGSDGGKLTIYSGQVYAEGRLGARDIGYGARGVSNGQACTISGNSALFMRSGNYEAMSTPTHKRFEDEVIASGQAYGYTVPAAWADGDTAYAWLPGFTVSYRSGTNGSFTSGSLDESVISGTSPDTPPVLSVDAGYNFIGWNDGTSTSDNLNDFTITADTTLTAQYSPITVTGVSLDITSATLVLGDADLSNDTIDLTETISPDDALNQDVTWSSDNTLVATVDTNGTVTAHAVGRAKITVTTDDGNFQAVCQITVMDDTAYDVSKYAGLSGSIADNTANLLENWDVTVYSTPVSATTNAGGAFAFSNVQYSHHTLVFTDPANTEIDRYILDFVLSSNTGYSISGDTITINYASYTTNVILDFEQTIAGTEFNLTTVTFEGRAVNPTTGDTHTNYLWFILAAIILFGAIAAIVIIKKLNGR